MSILSRFLFVTLLVVAYAIEYTYLLGVYSKPYIKALIALAIVLSQYTLQAARYVYTNRRLIQQRINEQFVYTSPTYAAV